MVSTFLWGVNNSYRDETLKRLSMYAELGSFEAHGFRVEVTNKTDPCPMCMGIQVAGHLSTKTGKISVRMVREWGR
jgi:hypothetical protein